VCVSLSLYLVVTLNECYPALTVCDAVTLSDDGLHYTHKHK